MAKKQPPRSTILIVDDDPAVGKFFKKTLEAKGYTCHLACDAEAANICVNRHKIDLILCDVVMPGKSGIDLIESLKSDGFDGAVIMVTGLDDPAGYESALALGAYGYLIKPVAKNQLLISTANALRRRALEQEVRSYVHHLNETKAHLEQTVEELQQANRTIVAHQNSLVEKERLKALLEMARAAAHEMNQPLMALLVHIELMAMDRNDPAAFDAHMNAIEACGQKLSEVIEKMLSIKQYTTVPYHGDESMIDLDQ